MQKCGCGCARVELKETILKGTRGSNAILFNGIPLEKALPSASVGRNECPSCTELTGRKTSCRTLKHGAATYETIPLKLLRQAACSVLQCCA